MPPLSPKWEPSFIEHFNRTYRTGTLDFYLFKTLNEAREIIEHWLTGYNSEHPWITWRRKSIDWWRKTRNSQKVRGTKTGVLTTSSLKSSTCKGWPVTGTTGDSCRSRWSHSEYPHESIWARYTHAGLWTGLSVSIGYEYSRLVFLCGGRRSGGNDSWIFRLGGKSTL